MRISTLLLVLCFLFTTTPASAQEVVEVTEQNFIPALTLRLAGIPAEYNVQNYKILYTSTDPFGNLDTLSGLISLPVQSEFALPITVYNHGTVANREAVPSRVTTLERFLVYAVASNGYNAVAPDYFGLGDNPGLHPYVHRDSEAQAGRDLILAARSWMDEQNIAYNEQLFTTGYSQGGHASMALQRDLHVNPAEDLDLTAAAHLSGPYSISEVMVNTLFEEQLSTRPGYVVYAYISFNFVNQLFDDNNQIFVDPYVSLVDSFQQELLDLGTFSDDLLDRLEANDDQIVDVFQDSIVQQLMAMDTSSSRIYRAIVENDTYRFAAEAPTLMVYCTEDEQVPFQNALLADSVMRQDFGVTTTQLLNGGALDHGGCIDPAITAALTFFGPIGRRDPITSVGVAVDLPELRVAPNPALRSSQLYVSGLSATQDYPYFLYDATGRQVASGRFTGNGQLTLPATSTGMNVLRIALPDGNFATRRLFIR